MPMAVIADGVIGEKFAELETNLGKVYRNVVIKSVDAQGIKIIHDAGIGRIKFNNLPKELAERFRPAPSEEVIEEDEAMSELEGAESLEVLGEGFRLERAKAIGEELGELKTGPGKIYKRAVIKAVDDVGIRITHAGGVGRISFEDLPRAMGERFGYDPRRVEVLKAEAKAQAAAQAEARRKVREERARVAENSKGMPKELSNEAKRKIQEHEVRIRKLNEGIANATKEIAELREKAAYYMANSQRSVRVTMPDGSIYTEMRSVPSKVKRAQTHQRNATRLEKEVGEANQLIAALGEKIRQLRDTAK